VSPSLESSDTTARVRAARAGDREAFGELYRRYGPMVHGICLARVPPQDARDLVQEVFIQALRRLGQLRDDAAFGGWLAALARHAAADFHRRPDRRAPPQELPPDLAAVERADGGAGPVLAAIRALPPAYRETLMLRLVEGMSGPEIAQRTGLQADSVRVNLHRGMKLLREALGGSRP
jgi:RNA polymerase sigma-70 factor (ECF subfamily)